MRKSSAVASTLVVALMMSVVAPSISQAAPPETTSAPLIQPYAAQGCAGDTCLYLSSPSGGTVLVEAWAYSTNFYGYFVLSAPSGSYYSATQTWIGGKGNYAHWSGIPATVGQYCVTGYTSGGSLEGTACEYVL